MISTFGSSFFQDEEDDFSQNQYEEQSKTDYRAFESTTQIMTTLIVNSLIANCPVLSGNLKTHVSLDSFAFDKCTIKMVGRMYDTDRFVREGRVVYTGKGDYANYLNTVGAFGQGGKDVGWATKAVMSALKSFASYYNASIIVL